MLLQWLSILQFRRTYGFGGTTKEANLLLMVFHRSFTFNADFTTNVRKLSCAFKVFTTLTLCLSLIGSGEYVVPVRGLLSVDGFIPHVSWDSIRAAVLKLNLALSLAFLGGRADGEFPVLRPLSSFTEVRA